jgi:quercetin dioxygenase-like cupin family protein
VEILSLASLPFRLVTEIESQGAEATEVARGQGEAHVHILRIEAGGAIGPHEAGFGQLYVIVSGRGWVAGPDAKRIPIAAGEAACIRKGEVHAKGADEAVVALVVQVEALVRLES